MPSPSDANRKEAQRVFHEHLASQKGGQAQISRDFIALHPSHLHEELERLVADYTLLRRAGPAPSPGGDGEVVGDFRLLREIGRGGMGTVWEAEQISLRRRVALKLLHPHFSLSPDKTDRFRREAEAGARMNHPGIVAILAVGEQNGQHYMAQELVAGGRTLADWLAERRREKSLADDYFQQIAVFIAKVADALQVAHAAQIIHRDIKPSNIMISETNDPKVADFGLARFEDRLALSRSGQLMGTPYYMSPEQAASSRIGLDHRTDIFSLGATMYEALTLRRPFDGDTSQQILSKILLEDPPDPRQVRSRVPRELSTICSKAMEKRPERRYEAAAHFADDLRRWLNHEPILASPPGRMRRVAKFVRRHPTLSTTAALGSASFAVFTFLLSAQLREARAAQAARTDYAAAVEQQKSLTAAKDGAVQERNKALQQLLALWSTPALEQSPALALLLATESAKFGTSFPINDAMLAAMDGIREERSFEGLHPVLAADWTSDGQHILRTTDKGVSACKLADGGTLVLRDDLEASGPAFLDGNAAVLVDQARIRSVDLETSATRLVAEFGSDMRGRPGAHAFAKKRRTAAIGTSAGALLIVDLSSGKVSKAAAPADVPLRHLQYSADEDWLVAAWDSGRIIVFEASDQRPVATLELGGRPDFVAVSPDRRWIATSLVENGVVQWWRAGSWADPHSLAPAHRSGVPSRASFIPGTNTIAISGFGPHVHIVDLETRNTTGSIDTTGRATALAVDPSGSLCATGELGGNVRIWALTGHPLLRLRGHSNRINVIRFGDDGRLLTGGSDGSVKVWRLTHPGPADTDHVEPSRSTISASTRRIAFPSSNQQGVAYLNVAGPTSGKIRVPIQGPATDENRRITSAPVFSPDCRHVLVGLSDGSTRCIDAQNGIETRNLHGHSGPVSSILFDPRERLLMTSSVGRQAVALYAIYIYSGEDWWPRVWDATNGGLRGALRGHIAGTASATFSADGTRILIGSYDGTASLWDAISLDRIQVFAHEAAVVKVAFAAGDARVFTASWDGTARIWDSASGKELHRLEVEGAVAAADISQDGSVIVTADGAGKCVAWQTETGRHTAVYRALETQVPNHWTDPAGSVTRLSLRPDGRMALAISSVYGPRFWSTANGVDWISLFGRDYKHAVVDPSWSWAVLSTPSAIRVVPTDPYDYAMAMRPRDWTDTERLHFGITDSTPVAGSTGKAKATAEGLQWMRWPIQQSLTEAPPIRMTKPAPFNALATLDGLPGPSGVWHTTLGKLVASCDGKSLRAVLYRGPEVIVLVGRPNRANNAIEFSWCGPRSRGTGTMQWTQDGAGLNGTWNPAGTPKGTEWAARAWTTSDD